MKTRTLLFILISSFSSFSLHTTTAADAQPAPAPNDPASLDLFLLVGQSNMAGRGKVGETDRVPDPRILVFNKDCQWANQGEPIHFDKPDIAGVGLGFTFAKLVANCSPGKKIGLIPCAVGGTPISRWKPGGDLFEEAVRRARLAQKNGTLKAILWHQGESEAGNQTAANAYGQNLVEVAAGLRKALNSPDLPFIAGEIGQFLYDQQGPLKFAREINSGIDALPSQISAAAAVSSEKLADKGDHLHFDAASQKEFARRYFDAYRKLVPDAAGMKTENLSAPAK
jgi:hypothetical protein